MPSFKKWKIWAFMLLLHIRKENIFFIYKILFARSLRIVICLSFFFHFQSNLKASKIYNHSILTDSNSVIAFPISQNNIICSPIISLPTLITTIILRNEDRHFEKGLNTNLKSYKYWYDTPLSIFPATAMLALKIAGVPSRSSWDRMLISDATGGAIAFGMSNLLKYWVTAKRPDGSSFKSFPSDHTVCAFATATMLEQEYGHLSPLISIGGYTLATASAFTRINNNRHWVSDVIEGISLGTASAQTGYVIGDLIFKEKGLNDNILPFFISTHTESPSYAAVYSSCEIQLGYYNLGESQKLSFKTGYSSGIEGAWFYNSNIGLGGKVGLINVLPKLNNIPQNFSLDFLDTEGGFFMSFPAGKRTLLGGRFLGGTRWLINGNKKLKNIGTNMEQLYITSCGLSLDFRTRKHMSVRFFGDYGFLFRTSYQQYFSIGMSTCYRF